MKILFAMDLLNNRCVRLQKGDFTKLTVYSENPVFMIEEMLEKGARDFHIIDLDGARTGKPVHHEIIRAIRKKVAGYMEVGGGIRSLEDICYYTDCGMDGIIVGTRALEDDRFFKELSLYKNIILGLDLYEGRPMVRGWKEVANRAIEKILMDAEENGIMAILCTSIERDGMLVGPDYEAIEKVMGMTEIPLIASGGVTTIDDVKRLKDLGVWAAILGKTVYEGLLTIEEVIEYADQENYPLS